MQKLKLRREIRGASCSERLSLSVLSEKQNIIKREVKTCAFYFPLFAFSNFCDWIFYYVPSTDKRLVNGGNGFIRVFSVDQDGDLYLRGAYHVDICADGIKSLKHF